MKGINLGKKNGQWKGNKVSYKSLHQWVRRHKPKSMFCECCGKITEKLDCANISGDYLRDISDWRWLCRKCHMKEDGRATEFNNKRNQNIKEGNVKRDRFGRYIK